MSAGESFITTLNESTGYENVALVNKKYHALDAEILACQGQTSGKVNAKVRGYTVQSFGSTETEYHRCLPEMAC